MLILLVLLIGVPAALLTVLGPPIPHTMPALSLLTHRLDIPAILKILSVVVWLAWLQLVACLIAEVRAAVRNTGMPPRVPLARWHPASRAPAGDRRAAAVQRRRARRAPPAPTALPPPASPGPRLGSAACAADR